MFGSKSDRAVGETVAVDWVGLGLEFASLDVTYSSWRIVTATACFSIAFVLGVNGIDVTCSISFIFSDADADDDAETETDSVWFELELEPDCDNIDVGERSEARRD